MPNLPMVSIETPISAGAETSKQPGMVQKSSVNRKEPLAFKKKLEDCIKVDDTPYGVPSAVVNQTQDISMASDLTDTQVKSQIVGNLEGFGLLDYQSNLPLVSPESSLMADEQTVNEAELTLLQGLNMEQIGALEKYARMLSKDQLIKLPIEMQQAIAKAVGDYLGSFESTNNEPAQTPAVPDAKATSGIALAAEAAMDISALSDKIASLLIKLKAMQQEAKPTDVASETQTPVLEAAAPAEKPQTEAAKPAEQQTTVQSMASKPGADKSAASQENDAMQAVKPDAKTLASTDAAQTQRIDTAVNLQSVPTAQTDTDGVTQTAKAPEAPGTDFVKDNVMRIVDKMGTQVSDGKYEFDMELKPDFLGKVNIKLSMQNGEIRMQIKTDDVNVKGMFADQVSSMQAVLKDKGITVTNIDVTYQSQMQTGEDRHSESHSGNGKKQGSRVQVSLEQISGAGVFETMSQITGYTHGNSSVEYLA